jgi:hypothetical protein
MLELKSMMLREAGYKQTDTPRDTVIYDYVLLITAGRMMDLALKNTANGQRDKNFFL